MSAQATPIVVTRAGVTLHGEEAGEGPAVVLLHGLTATRRYVLHGSRTLERAGYRVITFDARGHGESSAAPDPALYNYEEMIADTVAVLDALGVDRAAFAGQSMGAAVAAGLALRHPERVSALAVVTPAHRGRPSSPHALERWDRLAAAVLEGGPEAFVAALEPFTMEERWRDTVRTVVMQRIARHDDRKALADALRNVPRSAAFDGMEVLRTITVPTLVVGSRDTSDPDHPLEIAEEYSRIIPGARFIVESPGESPLAWRGGALSKEIAATIAGAA